MSHNIKSKTPSHGATSVIEKFTQLFRRELTTVQVCMQLLRFNPDVPEFDRLVAFLHRHQNRVDRIHGEIRQLGGITSWLVEVPDEVTLEEFNRQEESTRELYQSLLHDSDFSVQLLIQQLIDESDAVPQMKAA